MPDAAPPMSPSSRSVPRAVDAAVSGFEVLFWEGDDAPSYDDAANASFGELLAMAPDSIRFASDGEQVLVDRESDFLTDPVARALATPLPPEERRKRRKRRP